MSDQDELLNGVWVCNLCGQALRAEGDRCNSSIHNGPDDPEPLGTAVLSTHLAEHAQYASVLAEKAYPDLAASGICPVPHKGWRDLAECEACYPNLRAVIGHLEQVTQDRGIDLLDVTTALENERGRADDARSDLEEAREESASLNERVARLEPAAYQGRLAIDVVRAAAPSTSTFPQALKTVAKMGEEYPGLLVKLAKLQEGRSSTRETLPPEPEVAPFHDTILRSSGPKPTEEANLRDEERLAHSAGTFTFHGQNPRGVPITTRPGYREPGPVSLHRLVCPECGLRDEWVLRGPVPAYCTGGGMKLDHGPYKHEPVEMVTERKEYVPFNGNPTQLQSQRQDAEMANANRTVLQKLDAQHGILTEYADNPFSGAYVPIEAQAIEALQNMHRIIGELRDQEAERLARIRDLAEALEQEQERVLALQAQDGGQGVSAEAPNLTGGREAKSDTYGVAPDDALHVASAVRAEVERGRKVTGNPMYGDGMMHVAEWIEGTIRAEREAQEHTERDFAHQALRERVQAAGANECTCFVKTMDPAYHAEWCPRYLAFMAWRDRPRDDLGVFQMRNPPPPEVVVDDNLPDGGDIWRPSVPPQDAGEPLHRWVLGDDDDGET